MKQSGILGRWPLDLMILKRLSFWYPLWNQTPKAVTLEEFADAPEDT